MVKQVFDTINNEFAFVKGKQLGIAISGGLDSMVLSHMLVAFNLRLTLLHCNFKLREDESEQDQAFLETYANAMQLPLICKAFDTKAYAKKHKLSTQMAARALRYNWFDTLVQDGTVDYIATAHHSNDSIETLLINLSRGSGISGLSGIPAINGHIIRPFLKFTRAQILDYATQAGLKWREDSSNATDAYLRNAIRHKVIPELEALSPDFIAKASETQVHLRESDKMLKEYTIKLVQELVVKKDDSFVVNIKDINSLSSPNGFLFGWLQAFGFTAWDDINDLLSSQSGKQVFSPSYVLTHNRDTLVLSSIKEELISRYTIDQAQHKLTQPIQLIFDTKDNSAQNTKNKIVVDADLLTYPLELRHWQDGDRFYPLGMEGSKKVSDYFTDLKISRPEKEKIWLLCSDQKIIWIVGYRGDNRFKISPSTQNTLAITYHP